MSTKTSNLQETTTCAIRLPVAMLDYLKRVARQRSVEEDDDVTYGDLVREACSRMFPLEEAARQ